MDYRCGRLEGRGLGITETALSETDCTRDSVLSMSSIGIARSAKPRNRANEMRFPASREDDGNVPALSSSAEAAAVIHSLQ